VSSSESVDDSESEVVAVTKHGQATIPKRFRNKLGIDAPGKVAFRETESGEIVVERVRTPREMRGFVSTDGDDTTDGDDQSTRPSDHLREMRRRDRDERDARFEEE
jgi:AbrB family looped-hinge helix DNA binding protein